MCICITTYYYSDNFVVYCCHYRDVHMLSHYCVALVCTIHVCVCTYMDFSPMYTYVLFYHTIRRSVPLARLKMIQQQSQTRTGGINGYIRTGIFLSRNFSRGPPELSYLQKVFAHFHLFSSLTEQSIKILPPSTFEDFDNLPLLNLRISQKNPCNICMLICNNFSCIVLVLYMCTLG